jgi:hypothetical protein
MTDNVTHIDPIAALEAEARDELKKEYDKNDLAKIRTSLRRLKDAQLILANLQLEHETLMRDLRARRNTQMA